LSIFHCPFEDAMVGGSPALAAASGNGQWKMDNGKSTPDESRYAGRM
jgi:hypothetical protein